MKKRSKLPFRLRIIQGAIGKTYVIKHYKWGIIKTKYPDMTKIIASPKQRTCRNLFREAVLYARAVIADPVGKASWQKRLRRRNGVYNEAVKAYLLKDKLAKERDQLLTNRLIRNAFKDQSPVSLLHPKYKVGLTLAVTLPQKTNNYESIIGSG
jgi:hypothetical protein